MKRGTTFFLLQALCIFSQANEYHVTKNGINSNPGTAAKPFPATKVTADKAMPGDIFIILEGIYRERVELRRGGTSELNRIIYHAAENGKTETSDRPLPGPFDEPGRGTISMKVW